MKYLFIPVLLAAPQLYAADSTEQLFKKVDPVVVMIKHENAIGSGFILSNDGLIVSNGHVIKGKDPDDPLAPAKRITVELYNKKKYSAKVIGFAMDPDVSLLKIDPEGNEKFTAATIGDSSLVETGQKSYAVGAPQGLDRTLTAGVISNTERLMGTFTTVLQTDAAINPGNSGGPLFNEKGEVVGINTYGQSMANNLGFTIPIDVVLDLVEDLNEYGRWKRADLPFFLVKPIPPVLGQALGVDGGIYVDYVEPDSIADLAGMLPGDIITKIDGETIQAETAAQLSDLNWDFVTREIGSSVDLTVLRKEEGEYKEITFPAVLVEDDPFPPYGYYQHGEIEVIRYASIGLRFQALTTFSRYVNGIRAKTGVRVVSATGSAKEAGIYPNAVIYAVNGTFVSDEKELERELNHLLQNRTEYLIFSIRHDHDDYQKVIKPEYQLEDRSIIVVGTPSNLIKRKLSASGASIKYVENSEDIAKANWQGLLLLSIPHQGDLANSEELKKAINTAVEEKRILGAVGESPLVLLQSNSELLEKKITLDETFANLAIGLKANYTGRDNETDAFVVTSNGFDKPVVTTFINNFVDKVDSFKERKDKKQASVE